MTNRHDLFLPSRSSPAKSDAAIAGDPGDALHVDACGTRCPVPLLRLRKALGRSAPGQVLELTTDDPTAFADIPRALPSLPAQLFATRRDGDRMVFTLLRR